MRENGTDRDIALQLVDTLGTIAAGVVQINDNLFVPHITTQPTNQTGSVGDTITFSIVANNVSAYQWQYKQSVNGPWKDSSFTGYNTTAMEVEVSDARYGYWYRCKITGKDNSTLISDVVQILEPAPEPEG